MTVTVGHCLSCNKVYTGVELEKFEECDACGGHSIALGDKYNIHDGKIVCICGHSKFKKTMHMNMGKIQKNIYQCGKCSNTITIDTIVDDIGG